ncbi:hypothetical protein KKHLCK_02900 [Candidatus Electrothrix laxa]
MKNILSFLSIFIFLLFQANAGIGRQGCCSHHGGVCGGRCCDGTSLSLKCGGGGISIKKEKVTYLWDVLKTDKIYSFTDGNSFDLHFVHGNLVKIESFFIEEDEHEKYILIYKTVDGKEEFSTLEEIKNLSDLKRLIVK